MTPLSVSNKALVFITLSYAPLVGGTEKQAQLLLERCVQQGDLVWVLTRRIPKCPNYEKINGVHVYRLASLWWPGISWVTFSLSVLFFLFPRRNKVRSLWGLMLNVSTCAAVLASQALGRPVIIKLSSSGEGGNLKMMLQSLVGGWMVVLLRMCDGIIAVNSEAVSELEPYQIPGDRIKKIPNGVDVERFKPATTEQRTILRNLLRLTNQQVAVLFVGRMEAEKNLKGILTVWPRIFENCPNARLVLVGDGQEKSVLESSIQGKAWSQSVQFLGQRENVIEVYQAADMFLLPSLYEGMSNALLEAMACQLPVVVSRIAGNSDVVTEAKEGVFIPANKPEEWFIPLTQLIENEARRKEMGFAARQTVVDFFSMDAIFKQYQELFRRFGSD